MTGINPAPPPYTDFTHSIDNLSGKATATANVKLPNGNIAKVTLHYEKGATEEKMRSDLDASINKITKLSVAYELGDKTKSLTLKGNQLTKEYTDQGLQAKNERRIAKDKEALPAGPVVSDKYSNDENHIDNKIRSLFQRTNPNPQLSINQNTNVNNNNILPRNPEKTTLKEKTDLIFNALYKQQNKAECVQAKQIADEFISILVDDNTLKQNILKGSAQNPGLERNLEIWTENVKGEEGIEAHTDSRHPEQSLEYIIGNSLKKALAMPGLSAENKQKLEDLNRRLKELY